VPEAIVIYDPKTKEIVMDNSEFKKLVGKFSHLKPQLSQSDLPVEAKKAKTKRRNPFKTREILDDGDIDYKYHKGSSHYS
jgi:hypothetical protein